MLRLKAGPHPFTSMMLPPPVSIDPEEDVPAGMVQPYRASEAGRVYAATEQDLNPRMQLLLERVRKRERERTDSARVVRRRIAVKSSPLACPGYEPPTG